jgi:3-keto-5-aminohexanoate cleavage enzyme
MLDLDKDWTELPSRTELLSKRRVRILSEPPTPALQEKWDIPELLVVTSAPSGRIARQYGGDEAADLPMDFDSYIGDAVDSIENGACGVHIDFGGIPAIQSSGLSNPECYDRIMAGIAERTTKDWVPDLNVLRGRNFAEDIYPMSSGLGETAPMAPNFPIDWMEAVATVVGRNNQRLFFAVHSTAEVDLADRYLVSRGLVPTPGCWGILIGYPYDDASDRLATYLKHPRAMLTELIQIVDRIREIDPDGFIFVCTAGRAGHYLATAAILMGLHVRVGTEDTFYRYPHKDEVLTGSVEMIDRVRVTAEALGRRLATPAEYRQMIGLPERSSAVDAADQTVGSVR